MPVCPVQPAVLVRRWAYKGPLHQLHYILSGAHALASPSERQAPEVTPDTAAKC